jgi:cobalt-zinc-cadmium efflux system protein
MGHHHDHHHHHHSGSSNLLTAFFLNLFFAVVELIGGWYTNSMAIMSDALHDLGDSISLGLSWYFEKISKKGRNHEYSYGFKRFNVLGAIINSVILTTGSVLIVVEAIPRLFDPVMPNTKGMIILSFAGLAVNGFAALKISKGESLNQKVAYLHLMEDILGWAATLIMSVVLYFRALPILDPILSILIACYVLYNVIKNIKASLSIILQATPREIDPQKIEASILAYDEVSEVHDCHIWTMDGNYHILSIHVITKNAMSMTEIASLKTTIKEKLKQLNINHVTLEFELPEENCQPC